MPRVAAKQLQSVRYQVNDGFQRLDCARRASGEVQDDRLSAHTADGPAESGQWSFLRTFCAHAFSYAFEQTFADGARGFGSDIARSNSGASRGHHQPGTVNPGKERLLDGSLLVRNGGSSDDGEIVFH